MIKTEKLDALLKQSETNAESYLALKAIYIAHGHALVAALKDCLEQWGNRGEETSLHEWNYRVKWAMSNAESLLTHLEQEAQ